MYSTLDASANGGLGRVLLKNQMLEQDTFTGMITAVRHANGRDWWLLVQENFRTVPAPAGAKGIYHRYLIDPGGIHGPVIQRIGALWSANSTNGQASFSPDGRHYAIGSIFNGVSLFDFDRCSGLLSNPRHLPFGSDTCWTMGVAFSPGSRFLYVTTGGTINQFDLKASDVVQSKKVVAVYDGYAAPYPTSFYQLRLGPDRKIYGSCPNGVDRMHIIHAPDEPGTACQVEQHGLHLPTYHKYTVPNLAWYGLYDEPGTVCDSLGIDTPVAASEQEKGEVEMACFPNPADAWLTVRVEGGQAGRVLLCDLTGRVRMVQAKRGDQDTLELELAGLPAGMYGVSFVSENGRCAFQKIAVWR